MTAMEMAAASYLSSGSSQGGGVEVHVDLHVLGQLSALVEDAGQVAHGVVPEGPVVGAKEGVLDSLAMAGEVKHGLHLHALPLGRLHLRGVHVHILLAPALAPVVVDVDAPQQLGLIGAGAGGDVGDGSEEDEGGLHLCAAVQVGVAPM